MLKQIYNETIRSSLRSKLAYGNVMQVPKVSKVCLNIGMGSGGFESKFVKSCVNDLALISSQVPVVTFAKKSIAAFKIRKGMSIGCKVTLRHDKMYQFLERLIYIVLPREREFKGFSVKNFDGNGNMSFGIKEHISFLEIDYDKIDKILGVDVSIVTTAIDDFAAKQLMIAFGFPFSD